MMKNISFLLNIPTFFKLVFVMSFCLVTLCSCGSNGASKRPQDEFYGRPGPIVVSEIGQPTQQEDFNDTKIGKQIKQDYRDYLHNLFVYGGNPNPVQVPIDALVSKTAYTKLDMIKHS